MNLSLKKWYKCVVLKRKEKTNGKGQDEGNTNNTSSIIHPTCLSAFLNPASSSIASRRDGVDDEDDDDRLRILGCWGTSRKALPERTEQLRPRRASTGGGTASPTECVCGVCGNGGSESSDEVEENDSVGISAAVCILLIRKSNH